MRKMANYLRIMGRIPASPSAIFSHHFENGFRRSRDLMAP
jgi:hypothetical protein